MPMHEFGIMSKDPSYKDRFDSYEPHRYDCIDVDDDLIAPILRDFANMDCFWHTLQLPGKGLAYCGITLIPPNSLEMFIKILSSQSSEAYNPLLSLAAQAKTDRKYIIHFGI